jgi:SAM-dependent methyltransferase
MQYVNCNICDTDETILVTIQNNYRVVKCKNCGLVYVNPRPDTETLLELYNDYHQRNGKDEYTWARLMEKNFKEVSALLNRIIPKTGKVLDIGCGYGHFMEIMRDYRWPVCGIDPSSKVLSGARKKGLNVIETTINNASFPCNSFDAITAFYVLEHLSDPLTALKKIFMILRPGGILIIRVPHTTPIVRFLSIFKIKNSLYDPPFHLYDFSPETITLLLKMACFSSIKIMPGSPTLPEEKIERIISIFSGNLSKLLFSITAGRLLLPGTSKTVIATKTINPNNVEIAQKFI